MTATLTPIHQATELITSEIRSRFSDHFADGRTTDLAGEQIYVHFDDAGYPATINWGRAWVDYDLLDVLNDRLDEARLPFLVEYYSDYEVTVVSL